MASGQTLITAAAPSGAMYTTAANSATLFPRNGWLVWEFNDSVVQQLSYLFLIPQNYAGGGITITLWWAADTAISGAVVWDIVVAAMVDLDTGGSATTRTVTTTTSGTNGALVTSAIAFLNAEVTTAGNVLRVNIQRDTADGSDTMVGDAQLLCLELKET